MKDFSPAVLRALRKRGVRVLRAVTIPSNDPDLPFATGERGYEVSDRGTSRVLTFTQVSQLMLDRVPA